jgi:hypothetical protein
LPPGREDQPEDTSEVDGAGEPYPGFLVYFIAAALYIAIGAFFPWVLSWWRGFLFAFIAVWAVTELYRTLRR